MAAFNACIMVGYVASAAVIGVNLESVEIETEGELDLRGFLGIDPSVKPGYDSIQYTVRMKGDGEFEGGDPVARSRTTSSPSGCISA